MNPTVPAAPAVPTQSSRRGSVTDEAPTRVQEIFGVAMALFLARGYDATPLSAIAAKLGITKAGLYHHFASKEQLLFDLHLDMMKERLIPIIERAEAEPDPVLRLERYLREYAELMGSDPAIRLLIEESKRLTPEHYQAIRAVWRRGFGVMRRSIEELQRAGLCDPTIHPVYSAFAAIGMCSWTLYWFDPDRRDALPAVAGDFTRIFMRGIGRCEEQPSPAAKTAAPGEER